MSTAVVRAEKRDEVQGLIAQEFNTLKRLLPQGIDPKRFANVALLALTKQPELLECTPASIVQSIHQAAQLGLEIGGPLQHASLVKFKDQATLVPGYRGLIYLAKRSGAIRKAVVRAVYEGEHFRVLYGHDDRIEHEPDFSLERTDDRISHVYVIFTLPDGETQFDVMTRQEVERVRRVSRMGERGAWVQWWGEMAKKSVVKRGFKMIPLSTEVAQAIEIDNRAETGEVGGIIPGIDTEESLAPPPQPTRTQSVRAHLERRASAASGNGGARAAAPTAASPIAEPDVVNPSRDAASSAVEQLVAFMFGLEPQGGDATDNQRNRIRESGAVVFAEGSPEREAIFALADDPNLGKAQAGKLVALVKGAAAYVQRTGQRPAATPAEAIEREVREQEAELPFDE